MVGAAGDGELRIRRAARLDLGSGRARRYVRAGRLGVGWVQICHEVVDELRHLGGVPGAVDGFRRDLTQDSLRE